MRATRATRATSRARRWPTWRPRASPTRLLRPEAEFYIFDNVRYSHHRQRGLLPSTPSRLVELGQGGREPGLQDPLQGRVLPGGAVRPLRRPARRDGQEPRGLRPARRAVHHEVGTAGQAEINYRFDTLLKAADDVMKFKYLIKNTAWEAGKSVTFMPKPIFGDNGSGMHVHQSLWKDGDPLFYDETGYGGLSDVARWYIGGILKARPVAAGLHQPVGELLPPPGARLRGADLARLLQPQPLRLGPHPDHGLEPEGQARRVPVPRPVGEPYLAFSALMLAGVDGIRTRSSRRPRSTRTSTSPAGRDGRDRPGPDLARRRPRRPRGRPRLPHGRQRLHPDLIETWID